MKQNGNNDGKSPTEKEKDAYMGMMTILGQIEQARFRSQQQQVPERTPAYPLFPDTSVMHYLFMAQSQHDYPGYGERLANWSIWNVQSAERHAIDPRSFLCDFVKVMNVQADSTRMSAAQDDFNDLVMKHAADRKHVLGYWYQSARRQRTLDLLASCTRGCIMLVKSKTACSPQFEWHIEFGDLNRPDSKVMQIERANPIPVVYMLDFTPRDVAIVASKLPLARLIGLTVPNPQHEHEMTAILEARRQIREANAKKEAEDKESNNSI